MIKKNLETWLGQHDREFAETVGYVAGTILNMLMAVAVACFVVELHNVLT